MAYLRNQKVVSAQRFLRSRLCAARDVHALIIETYASVEVVRTCEFVIVRRGGTFVWAEERVVSEVWRI